MLFGFSFLVADASTASSGPFDISGFWLGVLGSGAEVQSVSYDYQLNMTGNVDMAIGDEMSFSMTPIGDPKFSMGGGNLTNQNASGIWTSNINSQSSCSADPMAHLIASKHYNFKLCGLQPQLTLISSNSSVVSCSGISCTAVAAGTAQISAKVSSDLKVWGNNPDDAAPTWPFVNANNTSNSDIWNVKVYNKPVITFWANQTLIDYNTPATLQWNTVDAVSCTGSGTFASGDWLGTRNTSGPFTTVNLTQARTYILSCTGPGGTTQAAPVTINVSPPGGMPDISFLANPNLVLSGGTSLLSWTATNSDTCTATSGPSDWIFQGVVSANCPGSVCTGSYTTAPLIANQRYWLECSNISGAKSSTYVDVAVGAITPPAPTLTFREKSTQTNNITIISGDAVTLEWQTDSNATSCSGSGGDTNWPGGKSFTAGSFVQYNTPPLSSSVIYYLTCVGDGGSIGRIVTINVNEPPQPNPTVDLKVNGKDSESVDYGTNVNLTWTSQNSVFCAADGGWSSSTATNLSFPGQVIKATSTKTYRLVCTNNIGSQASDEVTVTVGAPPTLSMTFTASNNTNTESIGYNASTTIKWTISNATSCATYGGSGGWTTINPLNQTSFSTGQLASSVDYRLECAGYEGQFSSQTVSIIVAPPPDVTVDLKGDGSDGPVSIIYGGSINLTWTSQNADSCYASASPSLTSWSGNKATSGSGTIVTNITQNGFLYLQCWRNSPYQLKTDSVEVIVSGTPAPELDFWASQIGGVVNNRTAAAEIDATTYGDTALYLHWVSKYATSCTASGSGSWSGAKSPGTQVYWLSYSNADDLTYTLTCSNSSGLDAKTITVKICPDANLIHDPVNIPYNTKTNLQLCYYAGAAIPADYCKPTEGPQWWLDYGITMGDPDGKLYPSKCGTYTNYLTPNLTAPSTYFFAKCYRTGMESSCEQYGKETIGDSTTVNVLPLPVINFTASPPNVGYGFSSNLTWTTQNATSCKAKSPGPVNWVSDPRWGTGANIAGNFNTGPLFADRTYDIECTGLGGTQTASVTVTVGAIPGNPPQILNFWAVPNPTNYGAKTTLYWTTQDAYSCDGTAGSPDWIGTGKAANGSQEVGPLIATTTYWITCHGNGDVSAFVTVGVNEWTPVVVTLTATPDNHPYTGGMTKLDWTSTGNANQCNLLQSTNFVQWATIGSFPVAGSQTVATFGSIWYKAWCMRNIDGQTGEAHVFVTVTDIPDPVINLTAVPNPVDWGNSATISWSTNYTSDCSASSSLGNWSGSKATPSGSDPLSNLRQGGDYTLTCKNASKPLGVSQTITLNVNPPPGPVIIFQADSNNLPFGGSTTLRWTVQYATSCAAFGPWSGSKDPVTGTYNVGPLYADKTYVLQCSGPGGVNSASAKIAVALPANVPSVWINTYDSNTTLPYNSSTILEWGSTNANYCIGTTGPGNWTSGIKGVSGESDNGTGFNTGNLISSATYGITCSGNILSASASIFIKVNPKVQLPLVLNVWADKLMINAGEKVTIQWLSNATICYRQETNSDGDWVNFQTNGNYVSPALYGNNIYTITCEDSIGSPITKALLIQVGGGSYPNPEITEFSYTPDPVPNNTQATIIWKSLYTDKCEGIGGSAGWAGAGKPTDDAWVTTTNLTASTIFTLKCTGPSGYAQKDLTVNVGPPAGGAPKISITANSYNVEYNTATFLQWNVINAASCQGKDGPDEWKNDVIWGTPGSVSGSFATANLTKTTRYEIECISPQGTSASMPLDITVRKLIICPYNPSGDPYKIIKGRTENFRSYFMDDLTADVVSVGDTDVTCNVAPTLLIQDVTSLSDTRWYFGEINNILTQGGINSSTLTGSNIGGPVEFKATYGYSLEDPSGITASTWVSVINAICGDGSIDGSEVCDLGSGNGTCPKKCSLDCRENVCKGVDDYKEVKP